MDNAVNNKEDLAVAIAAAEAFVPYWDKLMEKNPEYKTVEWMVFIGGIYLNAFTEGYHEHKQKTEELMSIN